MTVLARLAVAVGVMVFAGLCLALLAIGGAELAWRRLTRRRAR